MARNPFVLSAVSSSANFASQYSASGFIAKTYNPRATAGVSSVIQLFENGFATPPYKTSIIF
jgi:hypothetical protein